MPPAPPLEVKEVEPPAPGLYVRAPLRLSAEPEPEVAEIAVAPPPVAVNDPVPASVRTPVDARASVPAALLVVTRPLLVRTPAPALTFMAMLLLEATVVLALTVVLPAPDVVVVTAPPLRLRIVEPPPADLAKVRLEPAAGLIEIAPPVETRLAEDASGEVICRPLVEVTETEEAVTLERAPSVS